MFTTFAAMVGLTSVTVTAEGPPVFAYNGGPTSHHSWPHARFMIWPWHTSGIQFDHEGDGVGRYAVDWKHADDYGGWTGAGFTLEHSEDDWAIPENAEELGLDMSAHKESGHMCVKYKMKEGGGCPFRLQVVAANNVQSRQQEIELDATPGWHMASCKIDDMGPCHDNGRCSHIQDSMCPLLTDWESVLKLEWMCMGGGGEGRVWLIDSVFSSDDCERDDPAINWPPEGCEGHADDIEVMDEFCPKTCCIENEDCGGDLADLDFCEKDENSGKFASPYDPETCGNKECVSTATKYLNSEPDLECMRQLLYKDTVAEVKDWLEHVIETCPCDDDCMGIEEDADSAAAGLAAAAALVLPALALFA